MAEALEIRDGSVGFKNVTHTCLVATESVTASAAAKTAQIAGKNAAEAAAASANISSNMAAAIGTGTTVLIGGAATAAITQWDYVHARDNIRRQYEPELSVQTGKHYNDLTNKDLDELGKKNAVIGDALKRAKWKRNAGLVIGTIAVTAAIVTGAAMLAATGGMFAAALTTLTAGAATAVPTGITAIASAFSAGNIGAAMVGLAQALTVGAAGVAAFMGTEAVSEKVAEKIFKHSEPSLHKVTRDPSLQSQLSLSSQVNYIEHLQKRVHSFNPKTFISQEQVFKTFLAANQTMNEDIKSRYGAEFSKLSADQRVEVLTDMGKPIGLEQLTADLNNRQVRAQELAFLTQGETSGVPRHEAPRITTLEKAHARMEKELAQAKATIGKLKQRIKATDTKLGKIQGATLDVKAETPATDAPVLDSQKAVGPATERLLAQRKAQQQSAARA